MTTVTFETLTFRADNEFVHVDLLRSYTTKISKEELRSIAPFTITSPHEITFENIPVKRAEKKFFSLLTKSFEHLTTKLTGNPATYIHRNSGIPLIGNVAFGIIYRNSSNIEIN